MGKQKQFKKIRRVASGLPVIETDSSIMGNPISGAALIKQGITKTWDGKAIVPGLWYQRPQRQALNHYRKMKKAYYKGGVDAVVGYMEAIVAYDRAKQHQAIKSETKTK